jgi:hypothetical protein
MMKRRDFITLLAGAAADFSAARRLLIVHAIAPIPARHS